MAHSIEITPINDQIPLLLQTEKDEIEEGRQVDHFIEIKETNGQDPLGSQTKKSVNQIFEEMFEDLDNSSIKSCTIFKVTVGLRESNPDAYTPKMVSIGPYHRKNPQLRPMKKYKLMYLRRFLQRKEGLDVESCMSELENMVVEALKCYEDKEDLDINDMSRTGEFMQMLLLDGCFVVEFIREQHGMCPEGEDEIINTNVGCRYNQVLRDLMLLENQIPFFVLNMLYHMTKQAVELPFAILANCSFRINLPKMTRASLLEQANVGNVKHLLHLVHMSWEGNRNTNSTHSEDKNYKVMPNATVLFEAGVSFKKFGNVYRSFENIDIEDTSLFGIKFENGQMKIPYLLVDDNTESNLRNLIAYEQQSDVNPQYVSDFATFMDHLIDSDKDVNLLRQTGIIENWIGEDKEVARLFNKIGKGVTTYSNFYYKEECRKATQYCKKPLNRMMASLIHNYFSSTWVGASTVAAIILLILTAMQTILAFTGGVK